jgi:hypothetical protein
MLNANVTATMWGFTPTNSSITTVDITPLDGSSTTLVQATGSPAKWSGAAALGDMIPQSAYLIKMSTSIRGRSHRGRLFLLWVAEGQVANGTLTGASVTVCTGAWATFLAAAAAAGIHLCVASYTLSTSTDVIEIHCESLTATQRRRQPGRS